MDINFNSTPKKSSDPYRKFHRGDYSDMIRERKELLPEVEKNLNKLLKNYEGGLLALILIEEDENGKPVNHKLFIGGTSDLKGSIALIKALDESRKNLMNHLVESASGDGKALMAVANELMSLMKEEVEG